MPSDQQPEIKPAPKAASTPPSKPAQPSKTAPTPSPVPAADKPAIATWSPLALAMLGALGGSGAVVLLSLALFGLFSLRGGNQTQPPGQTTSINVQPTTEQMTRSLAPGDTPPFQEPDLSLPFSPSPAPSGPAMHPTAATPTVAASSSPPLAAPASIVAESKTVPPTEKPKPDSKPETKQPTQPPTSQVAKPKPPARSDPFKGLEKTVTLPELPGAGAQPATAVLEPVTWGECKAGDTTGIVATLKGGGSIFRGGKQRFEITPTGNSPARHWEFQFISGDATAVVATLSLSEGKLNFQWTEEGVKQAANARMLCNCALDLAADGFQHTLALRQPVMGPPLAIAIEKGGGTARWTFEHLPDLKQVFLEPTRFDGLRRRRVEPPEPINPGRDLTIWTGPRDDMMFLGLKFDSDLLATGLKMTVAAQLKPEGVERPLPYSKKDMQNRLQQTKQQQQVLNQKLQEANKPIPGADRAQIDALKTQLRQEIDLRTKWAGQIDALSKYAADVQGAVAIHFRVYYQAEDRQVDLFIAGDPPPPPRPAPRPPAPPTTPKPAS